LESLWEVFNQARAAIKNHPDCQKFAALTAAALNLHLRPVTDKWHRAHAAGRLDSRDGADEFRQDFLTAQEALRKLAGDLHEMAYGVPLPDKTAPDPMTEAELTELFEPMPFGLPEGTRGLPQALINDINVSERNEVHLRRTKLGRDSSPAGHDAVGLALSGGGIRSAVFGLGVVQVLVDRKVFRDVDFLSTVSGGGYTGSFLTMLYGCGPADAAAGNPHGPDPDYVRYVRHHAKFLNPVNLKDGWSIVTQTLAGMILNWCVPLLIVVGWALIAAWCYRADSLHLWSLAVQYTLAAAGLGLVFFGMTIRSGRRLRIIGQWVLGITAGLAGIAIGSWMLEQGYGYFSKWFTRTGNLSLSWKITSVIAALTAAIPTVVRFSAVLQKPFVRKWAMKLALVLAGCAIPVGAVLLFYFCRHFAELGRVAGGPPTPGMDLLTYVMAALAVIALFVVNINLTAPHRIYRDRLAQTFIHIFDGPPPVPPTVQPTQTRRLANWVIKSVLPAEHARQMRDYLDEQGRIPLAGINPSGRAPYHLLNVTLNLPSSEEPSLRDRKCAFFLFSKHWTGAAIIGYHPTTTWKTNGKPVDLATCMAVSGAAASSQMGLGSMPLLAPLLTFLNVRLGFWIRQPSRPSLFAQSPGFQNLLQEMTGVGMSEKQTWLNLSDGGHSENTGIYELLRRRCKFIICVDGEADPGFTFGGLITLVRHAQIDLGIQINPPVDDLRVNPATGLSQSHALLCRIHYPGGHTGLLLYLKLSVTGNESQLIKRYRTLNAEYPHESTADQFFKEEQFEAYRQLGVHVAEGLFSPTLVGPVTPPSMRSWFQALASKLLLPRCT